jgi:hypothetical protein
MTVVIFEKQKIPLDIKHVSKGILFFVNFSAGAGFELA